MKEVLFKIEDIFEAYNNCIKNKKSSIDYLDYHTKNGKDDLFTLLDEINSKIYKVWKSYCFIARKPKLREIFAANFRDRIVHHLLISILEPYFEKRFIKNTFSCRKWKWAVLWIKTLFKDIQKLDKTYYFLQLDLKSFFMSINKDILYEILNKHLRFKNFDKYLLLRYLSKEIIYNNPVLWVEKKWNLSLFSTIVSSKSLFWRDWNIWLPIWNLTSQFFANVYLNELDRYIKKDLKTQFYYRYVDDFILLWTKEELIEKKKQIENFLKERLKLSLRETKTKLLPINYDIDFIWYIIRDTKFLLPRKRNINTFKQVIYKQNIQNKEQLNHTFASINSILWSMLLTKNFLLRKNNLLKLNEITFSNTRDFKKIIKNENIYNLLEKNKKRMKKYKEIQNKYKWYVIIVQIWCFYKIFDKEAIFLSENLWLKLTIFNPKTSWERIMCWFHEKSIKKYKDLIKEKQINTIFLKQIKQENWEITRDIEDILEFENNIKPPVYNQEKLNEIKSNYYKNYFDNKKIKSGEIETKNINYQEIDFLNEFKITDFSKKSFYEIMEFIINWKKIFSQVK